MGARFRQPPPSPVAGQPVMYKKILVALENSRADRALLAHVAELAGHFNSELLLVHVADGWVARNFEKMKLAESGEMKEDREYLEARAGELRKEGLRAAILLAMGEPSGEILRAAKQEQCDLIAMGGHGHRLVGDLLLGSTIHEVRHKATMPVLLVRAGTK